MSAAQIQNILQAYEFLKQSNSTVENWNVLIFVFYEKEKLPQERSNFWRSTFLDCFI